MQKGCLVFFLLPLLVVMPGCCKMPEVVDVAFERITIFEAPQKIRDEVERKKDEERAAVYVADDVIYIAITRGEKPTGGYGVRIVDIDKYILGEDRFGVAVKAEYSDPKPGQPVTQAVTYPFTIVRTDLKDIPLDTQFRFYIDGVETAVYPLPL